MRAIMVMYDSLNREMLQPYGCDWTYTPNFLRLAERCVQFENSFVGSLPCMPARRELQTGRMNFLHRSWGPMEPFDDSMPEILKQNGIYTHLVSDHHHYWEDGGATYHGRYSSWEASRGQEGDKWIADLRVKLDTECYGSVFEGKKDSLKRPSHKQMVLQDIINRRYLNTEEKTPQAVTFASGLDFIRRNHGEDNWFLQIETFDPHEPFYALPEDKALYPCQFAGDSDINDDWPPYAPVREDADTVQKVRYNYAALVSKCDRYLGKVLDLMDRYDMWKDTMLIVNTDHGFLLGEHGWWGKSAMPVYEEIAHTPLFIYDPRCPQTAGEKRNALVQTIDLAPTLLEFFQVTIPKNMLGKPLRQVIESDQPIRDYAVFGYFGSQINITDGKFLYMCSADNPEVPVYEYTLMPVHMRAMFSPAELQDAQLHEPFPFTKNCPVLKIKAPERRVNTTGYGNLLFDLSNGRDENLVQMQPQIVEKMRKGVEQFMREHDAPKELFCRFGFSGDAN